MTTMDRSAHTLAAVLACAMFGACGEQPAQTSDQTSETAAYDDSELGSASLQLAVVPTGVQCIAITTTSSSASNTLWFGYTAGTSTSVLDLGRLPLGQVTFEALAFDQACGSVAGQTPTWIADAVTTTLKPGVVANVALTLRRNSPVSASASFVDNLRAIAVGWGGTFAITEAGAVMHSGSTAGLAATTTPTPVSASLLPAVKDLRPGNNHHCYIDLSGNGTCWGYNNTGNLGNGTTSTGLTSAPGVVAVNQATSIAPSISNISANMFTCATGGSNGWVKCWGANTSGQLGNNTTTNSTTPVTSSGVSGATRVLAGDAHACAITRTGALYCWGSNGYGQLGLADTTNRLVPTLVPGETPVVSIALGTQHTCSLRADGTVRCWGLNNFGQVGDGTTANKTAPTLISLPGRAVQIAAQQTATCALLESGKVRCWGANAQSQLGDETSINRPSPVEVVGLPAVDRLGSGGPGQSFCAFKVGGDAYCWGYNLSGGVGDGTTENKFRATKVLF